MIVLVITGASETTYTDQAEENVSLTGLQQEKGDIFLLGKTQSSSQLVDLMNEQCPTSFICPCVWFHHSVVRSV